MNLDAKRPSEIELTDIRSLVDEKEPEGKRLDYKRCLPGSTPEEITEFLKDVSAFANASGGFIIYGIEEEKDKKGNNTGKPGKICGLGEINPDEKILSLKNILRDRIKPQISGIIINSIDINDSNLIVYVYIPASWQAPHMISYKGKQPFYVRTSRGKDPMDVPEIRHSFLASESLFDSIRNFRFKRISMIKNDDTPVVLPGKSKIVIHIIPIEHFMGKEVISSYDYESEVGGINPFKVGSRGTRYCMDGIYSYGPLENEPDSYFLLFRNKSCEAVNSSLINRNYHNTARKCIPHTYESAIICEIESYVSFLSSIGARPPLVVMLSLLNVRGHFMLKGGLQIYPEFAGEEINKEDLLMPDIIMNDLDMNKEEIGIELKIVYDQIWNACGHPKSPNYDSKGEWKGEK
ncbi:MAG TPA: ATP-binding protein [Acidobacteriota bacterium]|nr:ATP-binding protein [Acidobacteriota bacterium]